MDARIAVAELELTDPDWSLGTFDAFDSVRCLVRYRSAPIAWWDLDVVNGKVDVRPAIERHLNKLTHKVTGELLRGRLISGRLDAGSVRSLFNGEGNVDRAVVPVTVVVCTRNRTTELKSCLESLQRMDRKNVEILVVDNAPENDSTRKLVEDEFPEFRYTREENPGLDWARNRAWQEASYDVIAYTDDDVEVDPHWVRALATVFTDCDDVNAITGLVVPLELDTQAQRDFETYGGFDRGFNRRWVSVMSDDPNRARPWGTGQFGTGANMAFRKSVLGELGGFDPALDVGTVTNGGGDLEMLFRVLRERGTLVYEPRAIVRHRHRRDYDGLLTQIMNNGVGVVSYFQRTAIAYPSERRRLRQMMRWTWRNWYLKRLLQTFGSGAEVPRKLIFAEMRGFLAGFGRYRKSRKTAVNLGARDGIATEAVSVDSVERLAIPVAQSAMAVMKVDVSKPLPRLLDTREFRRTRVFVFSGESYIGKMDIKNHGRRIFRPELADNLVGYFGLRLLDPARQFDREALWVQGSKQTADLFKVSGARTEDSSSRLSDGTSVSVALATRDRPDELHRCLESLVNQETDRKLEIIVIDNNPASGLTPPVVAQFDGVRLLTQDTPGLSYARNTGIVAATGDIIVCVDDDVVVPSTWLEKLLEPFRSKKVAAVTGNVLPLTLGSRAAVLFERYGGLGRGNRRKKADRKWMSEFRGRAVPTWELGATANAAFRADVFRSDDIGLFDEVLGAGSPTGCSEDTLVFYNILAAGFSIVYEPNAWVWHEHRSSMPALRKQLYNYSKGHVAYHLLIFRRHRDFRSLKRILFTLPYWRLKQIYRYIRRRLRGGEPDFPLSLVFVEILGHVVGPFSLLMSALRVKRYGRISRPATETGEQTAAGVEGEAL